MGSELTLDMYIPDGKNDYLEQKKMVEMEAFFRFDFNDLIFEPRHEKTNAQAGLDPCWSQTHYVGLIMTWLICCFLL
jgi:hypothetical protein